MKKKAVCLLLLFLGIIFFVPGQALEPIDLILVLDTSSSMSDAYQEVINYISGPFMKEFLRVDDTFHLISFSSSPRFEISRRIESIGDVETILSRLFLWTPRDPYTDIAGALDYMEHYVSSLPSSRPRKVVFVTNGEKNLAPPGTSAAVMDSQALATRIAETAAHLRRDRVDFYQVTFPLTGSGPSSGRSPASFQSAQPSDAGQPPQTRQQGVAAQPSATAQRPQGAAVQPPATAQQPPQTRQQGATAQPSATAQQPSQARQQGAAAQPSATTQRPQGAAATQPPATAQQPPQTRQQGAAAQPSATAQRQQGVAATQPSATAQQPPQTRQQGAATQSPASAQQSQARQQSTAAQPPVITQQQGATVQPPATTQQSQDTASQSQVVVQQQEDATSRPPAAVQQPQTRQHGAGSPPAAAQQPQARQQDAMLQPPAATAQQPQAADRVSITDASFNYHPILVGLGTVSVLSLGLIIFYITRKLKASPSRVAAYVSERNVSFFPGKQTQSTKEERNIYEAGKESLLLSLVVEDQSTNIGRRNTHLLKAGDVYTIGGSKSDDYLICLVPVPAHIGEVQFNGTECTFVPRKSQYFPEIGSQPVPDCISKIIRVVSAKRYKLTFHLERYEDPLDSLNRLLNSVVLPPKLSDIVF